MHALRNGIASVHPNGLVPSSQMNRSILRSPHTSPSQRARNRSRSFSASWGVRVPETHCVLRRQSSSRHCRFRLNIRLTTRPYWRCAYILAQCLLTSRKAARSASSSCATSRKIFSQSSSGSRGGRGAASAPASALGRLLGMSARGCEFLRARAHERRRTDTPNAPLRPALWIVTLATASARVLFPCRWLGVRAFVRARINNIFLSSVRGVEACVHTTRHESWWTRSPIGR